MVLTRDLNKKVPKDQDLLGNFGNFGSFGNFGINNLESMGIPATGDVIVNVDGIPHIRTEFGKYLLEFNYNLPTVKYFTVYIISASGRKNCYLIIFCCQIFKAQQLLS